MGLFRKKSGKKACVIGLDGVPFSLLSDLARRDVMPFLNLLIREGYLHPMKASLPEISAVSWTNFMTGTNPGTHGIFGFTDLKPNSLDLRFPNFLDLKVETFWDLLGKHGRRSIIINQPSTYPARKINGTLISGFVAIDLTKAVHPLAFKNKLEGLDYQIDIDTFRCRENHAILWKDLDKTLSGRIRAFEILWEEDWDYFEFVITGTDRLHHFLWSAYEDESHSDHQNFLDYYNRIDGILERIATAFERLTKSRDGLFLLSDHGFTGIEQEVHLNAWLEKEGYLRLNTPSPSGPSETAPATLAFALDPNRIYLNLKGRFPHGRVEEPQKQVLKQEIKEKIVNFTCSGKRVVREVFDTLDIYSGPIVAQGPDLIVLGEKGFDMKGSFKKKELFGRTNLEGMHTWDDAFFWSSTELNRDLEIADIAEIIVDHLLS